MEINFVFEVIQNIGAKYKPEIIQNCVKLLLLFNSTIVTETKRVNNKPNSS